MTDREFALGLVQEDLDLGHAGRVVVAGVVEHELAWMVTHQSAEYLRTREFGARLVGGGLYLVDRLRSADPSIG